METRLLYEALLYLLLQMINQICCIKLKVSLTYAYKDKF